MPAMKEGKLLGFQLWINMPAKLKKNKPEYLYIKGNELGTYKDSEKIVKVMLVNIKMQKVQKKKIIMLIPLFHVVLNEKEFVGDIPEGHNSFIYLLKGELKIGEKNIIKQLTRT